MSDPYRSDREWSDRYLPEIKNIVGPRLLSNASFEIDTREATDLMVLLAKDMRIAARVRRPGFFEVFWDEFTIREYRVSGARTELEKIFVDGLGDWMFYGHAYENCMVHIEHWMIVDLHSWRDFLRDKEKLERIQMAGGILRKDNVDCSTGFRSFKITCFPREPSLLIATNIRRLLAWSKEK